MRRFGLVLLLVCSTAARAECPPGARISEWVFGGGLHPSDTATVVRSDGGEIVTTDGPYLESKEHIGGFWIIEAADLDAALDWAGKAAAACEGPVEVRPAEGG